MLKVIRYNSFKEDRSGDMPIPSDGGGVGLRQSLA